MSLKEILEDIDEGIFDDNPERMEGWLDYYDRKGELSKAKIKQQKGHFNFTWDEWILYFIIKYWKWILGFITALLIFGELLW